MNPGATGTKGGATAGNTPTRVTVVVSTYNQPRWLAHVLCGYAQQDFSNMDIVIADDGSGPETGRAIEEARAQSGVNIEHVWHEDKGFRKCAILNRAIVHSPSPYLIFTDGDCIPRRDFVSTHVSRARHGHFLSGGYFKLPLGLSRAITTGDIVSGRVFSPLWLKSRGVPGGLKLLKLSARGTGAAILEMLTPTKATWNGHNSSGWKTDIVAANGFDERMEYGGEDRELGERMMNAGVKPLQIRYSAVCVHLDHARAYRNDAALARNMAIRQYTARTRATRTEFGITSAALPPGQAQVKSPDGPD
jgi:glycosyltransferase involved in cell wall biosynthesis